MIEFGYVQVAGGQEPAVRIGTPGVERFVVWDPGMRLWAEVTDPKRAPELGFRVTSIHT